VDIIHREQCGLHPPVWLKLRPPDLMGTVSAGRVRDCAHRTGLQMMPRGVLVTPAAGRFGDCGRQSVWGLRASGVVVTVASVSLDTDCAHRTNCVL
jgi:hypothetical protein